MRNLMRLGDRIIVVFAVEATRGSSCADGAKVGYYSTKARVSTVTSRAVLKIATPRQMRAAVEYESSLCISITAHSLPVMPGKRNAAAGVPMHF
ncbi:hypothetical protein JQ609_32465 [Bradyrhizobium sp. AUGA SZCCT0169]|uniref:hypothetical protein n=1 Tax=Bradyrhizobium sp. AUGA SZCCT0169 TaxID=2807663 RepID=UPI001BAD48D3|nr:hypothetical protein [Bradyrhizobium sp. AUGA SZCCT0169]MBR1251617.1 hypothetical protein [Bradyrhizobium sp. AUGA SZCCT0169]